VAAARSLGKRSAREACARTCDVRRPLDQSSAFSGVSFGSSRHTAAKMEPALPPTASESRWGLRALEPPEADYRYEEG